LVVQAEGVGAAEAEDVGPFLTVREIAQKLRVSTATVYDLCDSGRLAHVRVNNAIRVTALALRRFLRTRKLKRAGACSS
jgi:excisionase family DNA binding protein